MWCTCLHMSVVEASALYIPVILYSFISTKQAQGCVCPKTLLSSFCPSHHAPLSSHSSSHYPTPHPPLHQQASVSPPLKRPGGLKDCLSPLGAPEPPTRQQILHPCVGLWSLGPDMWKQSLQREMKWYIELIQRWISNEQDLMSNQNTFTQHKQWLQRSGCMLHSEWRPWSVMTWIRYLIIIHRCECLQYKY